ncbi:S8 family peptidase [Mycobacterium sp. PDNC021]|uniref:S8 family peptidase n=1 Tax=Mycobacterium sp. PDNC021 TaxID=3391399 RepID=UPI003AB02D1F
MTAPTRFLIGHGERLIEPIPPIVGGNETPTPYTVEHARTRIGQMTQRTAADAAVLPRLACPDDVTVAALTLHPSYLSKSGYPLELLRSVGLSPVGSRPAKIVPEQAARRVKGSTEPQRYEPTEPRTTTKLFVAATRDHLRQWADELLSPFSEDDLSNADKQIVRLERVDLNTARDRDRLSTGATTAEVVLHSSEQIAIDGLVQYCADREVQLLLERRLITGGLVFVPVRGDNEVLRSLADYSFTRVVRAVPQMRRLLEEPPEPVRSMPAVRAVLPQGGPIDPTLRVAIFDGGLPDDTVLNQWATTYTFPDSGPARPKYLDHGQKVTSAILFGSGQEGAPVARPYANVDHYQVLDSESDSDPYELYAVIERIESVLTQTNYPFVSISIGPALPIEDDEVHAWTSFWDKHLADGNTLTTIAIGNNGALDRDSGNARVQVPADSVNAIAIGAADKTSQLWQRATYSAIGYGREPGVIKPDVLAFGGSLTEPFICVNPEGNLYTTCGTSFASPLAMRTALGIHTFFGSQVGPMAIKALLIHTADLQEGHDHREVGRGRIRQHNDDLTQCGDGEARILYQGTLEPARYVRAAIPLPPDLPSGLVTITATIVFATDVDPADPGNYTRSGLDVWFRPHRDRLNRSGTLAKTAPFFQGHDFSNEQELRRDAHKWDTVMHASHRKNTSSLSHPVFDIHYNARSAGHNAGDSPRIRYAMVITVRMPKVDDLYEQVLRTYATQLQALQPAIDLRLYT